MHEAKKEFWHKNELWKDKMKDENDRKVLENNFVLLLRWKWLHKNKKNKNEKIIFLPITWKKIIFFHIYMFLFLFCPFQCRRVFVILHYFSPYKSEWRRRNQNVSFLHSHIFLFVTLFLSFLLYSLHFRYLPDCQFSISFPILSRWFFWLCDKVYGNGIGRWLLQIWKKKKKKRKCLAHEIIRWSNSLCIVVISSGKENDLPHFDGACIDYPILPVIWDMFLSV